MQDTTKWIILGVVVLVIAVVGYIIYRKKRQYDFVFKMMKQSKKAQKEEERRREQEEAFAEKQLAKSSEEAEGILLALGGAPNIEKVEQCAIRLRVYVKNQKNVDQKALKATGISGIIKTTKNIQLVVGDRAEQIYEEIQRGLS